MPALRQAVNTSGNIVVTIPLNSGETTLRGGTGTMTVTIAATKPQAYHQILDDIDHLIRKGAATVAYS